MSTSNKGSGDDVLDEGSELESEEAVEAAADEGVEAQGADEADSNDEGVEAQGADDEDSDVDQDDADEAALETADADEAVEAAASDSGDEEEAVEEDGAEQQSAPGTGVGVFSEDEIAAATEGPEGDPELEEIDAANIDGEVEPEASFEKLVSKSRKLSPERIQSVLQSILFVSDRPLTVDQLYEATAISREQIEEALNKITGNMRDGVSGIVLHEVGGGWQFRTDPGSAEYVRRFLRVKPQRLTRAAVESLAIIAYRQPVTRPEIEDIRGVDCGAVMKALLDRKLIKILGKKEEVGRPILYGTTREFLEFFALKDLSSLPTLREFQELTREHQEIVEKETSPKPTAEGTVAALADPEFEKRLEESNQESEAALEALESAMSTAESRSKSVAQVLNPPQPPVEGNPDAGHSAGVNDSRT